MITQHSPANASQASSAHQDLGRPSCYAGAARSRGAQKRAPPAARSSARLNAHRASRFVTGARPSTNPRSALVRRFELLAR
eukprot:2427560-Pyramimonas_sp.AAC.1